MFIQDDIHVLYTVPSVRFEVGVSLLLAPARADKRGPEDPFSSSGKCRNAARDSQESTRRSSGGRRVLLKALCTCTPCGELTLKRMGLLFASFNGTLWGVHARKAQSRSFCNTCESIKTKKLKRYVVLELVHLSLSHTHKTRSWYLLGHFFNT